MSSIRIVFKLFAQLLAGEEYAAFYCTERESHLVGYFIVFVSGEIKAERLTVFGRESIYRGRDFFDGERAFGSGQSAVLRDIQVIQILCLVYDCGFAYGLTIIVDEDIAHDCEYPTLEVDIIHVLLFIIESLEGGVLK